MNSERITWVVRIFSAPPGTDADFLGSFEVETTDERVYTWRETTMRLFPDMAVLIDPMP